MIYCRTKYVDLSIYLFVSINHLVGSIVYQSQSPLLIETLPQKIALHQLPSPDAPPIPACSIAFAVPPCEKKMDKSTSFDCLLRLMKIRCLVEQPGKEMHDFPMEFNSATRMREQLQPGQKLALREAQAGVFMYPLTYSERNFNLIRPVCETKQIHASDAGNQWFGYQGSQAVMIVSPANNELILFCPVPIISSGLDDAIWYTASDIFAQLGTPRETPHGAVKIFRGNCIYEGNVKKSGLKMDIGIVTDTFCDGTLISLPLDSFVDESNTDIFPCFPLAFIPSSVTPCMITASGVTINRCMDPETPATLTSFSTMNLLGAKAFTPSPKMFFNWDVPYLLNGEVSPDHALMQCLSEFITQFAFAKMEFFDMLCEMCSTKSMEILVAETVDGVMLDEDIMIMTVITNALELVKLYMENGNTTCVITDVQCHAVIAKDVLKELKQKERMLYKLEAIQVFDPAFHVGSAMFSTIGWAFMLNDTVTITTDPDKGGRISDIHTLHKTVLQLNGDPPHADLRAAFGAHPTDFNDEYVIAVAKCLMLLSDSFDYFQVVSRVADTSTAVLSRLTQVPFLVSMDEKDKRHVIINVALLPDTTKVVTVGNSLRDNSVAMISRNVDWFFKQSSESSPPKPGDASEAMDITTVTLPEKKKIGDTSEAMETDDGVAEKEEEEEADDDGVEEEEADDDGVAEEEEEEEVDDDGIVEKEKKEEVDDDGVAEEEEEAPDILEDILGSEEEMNPTDDKEAREREKHASPQKRKIPAAYSESMGRSPRNRASWRGRRGKRPMSSSGGFRQPKRRRSNY